MSMICAFDLAVARWRLDFLNSNSSSISKYFRGAFSEISGIVTDRDDGVCAKLCGVREHQRMRLLPGCFTNRSPFGYVSATSQLAKPSKHTREAALQPGNANNDSSYNSKVLSDLVTSEIVSGGNYNRWSW